jgi:3-hydroxybutyryl-CoA dehydrogenase
MDSMKVFVVGAGTMGNGIAQTAAVSGYDVTMMDVVPEALERGMNTIEKSVGKLFEKGRITGEQKELMLGIKTAEDFKDVPSADIVIEAATENPELKFKLFTELDELASPDVILASNTSSISITRLAAATKRPEMVVGMHFFNPVPLMKLLEVVRGLATQDEVVDRAVMMGKKMGKTPVVVKDSPGFVSNRILCPMINEAIFTLQEGIASKEDIDTVMKLGMAHPMGPLTLADLIGLDVVLYVMEVLHENLGEDKYRPAPLLRRMVDAGYLGRKSGKGFFDYYED